MSIAQQAPACRLEFSKKEGLYANILPESYGANEFAMLKGYKYTFTSPPNEKGCTVISGEVKKANPYLLEYTWIVAEMKTETTVKWELTTTKEGTKLNLEHSGIANYEGETAVAMFESFNGGWDNCISGLTSYLKDTVNAG